MPVPRCLPSLRRPGYQTRINAVLQFFVVRQKG